VSALVPLSIQRVLYLAAHEPDLEWIPPERLRRPQQIREARIGDIGWRVGSALRTWRRETASSAPAEKPGVDGWRLPPHIRRAHWHRGVAVHATTEPSHGPAGQLARSSTAIFHGHALACLVAADRYHHLETEIEPALGAGKVVICDRYVPSSYALQVLDGVDQDFVAGINAHAQRPDLAVILTCDPVMLQQRLAARGSHGRFEDNHEFSHAETARFHVIAKMLPAEGIRTLVLDSTRHHADFLARQLTTAVQTLRSLPHH
jgi:dTMP kinase